MWMEERMAEVLSIRGQVASMSPEHYVEILKKWKISLKSKAFHWRRVPRR